MDDAKLATGTNYRPLLASAESTEQIDTYREDLLQFVTVQEANSLEQSSQGPDADRRDHASGVYIDEDRDHEPQEPSDYIGLRAKEVSAVDDG